MTHFDELSSEELDAAGAEPVDDDSEPVDHLTPTSGEDGFGLLRRKVSRVLEGLHQVMKCDGYQFWEERHTIALDAHTKLRLKLKKQAKDFFKDQGVSKEAIKRILCQEDALFEHSHDPDEWLRVQQQKDKEQREAERRSVREAARKLLEIEMKAQEDAKEALRKEKEDRKNAIIEAKMEALRQKEARKESLRLAKEEEKRMRDEEKELKRLAKEEEKRKKIEEKENAMKRRIEELRHRRKMREEQKSILENGVVTTSSVDATEATAETPSEHDAGNGNHVAEFASTKKQSATAPVSTTRASGSALRQQHLALLKFVADEKDRRRRIRVWEKKRELERTIWSSTKEKFLHEAKYKPMFPDFGSSSIGDKKASTTEASIFPVDVIDPIKELELIPSECQVDLLFAWDFISTFADCLRLTSVPSFGQFVNMVSLKDGSSPVGDGHYDGDTLGKTYAGFHIEVLKVLTAEYFPVLQTGTRLEEFYRTRPLSAFTWPEMARQVCILALEVKHPSNDDHLIKSLKGSKSNRDDSIVVPMRSKLHKRGIDLLNGLQYEAKSIDNLENQSLLEKEDKPEIVPVQLSTFYGVVLTHGISSKIELQEKDGHLAVMSIVNEEDATTSADDDNAGNIKIGDYLVTLNGHNVRGITLSALTSLLQEVSHPHGLLLSSIIPTVKSSLKHIPTTVGSTAIKRCAHVLKILRSKEIASPFNQPVDADLYPDYYTSGVISEAMDLGTIAEKIEDEDYENDDVESFMDDVSLVWKNCYAYNSMKAEISGMAVKLSAIFERLMKEWVHTSVNRALVSSEEDHCRNCQTNSVKDRLLLCDRCDSAYHTFCLETPLSNIPGGEWFCPMCLNDPSFSPERFKKKTSAGDNDKNAQVDEEELTGFDKKIQDVIDLLSKESYSELAIVERVKIFRVLCELLQGTAAVQAVYQSLEEKANDARKECGEALADLQREWNDFVPPHSSCSVEVTQKFFIDGVEHELTDELLEFLEEKATAEMEGHPIPPLPFSALQRLREQNGDGSEVTEDDSSSDDSDSERDEEILVELYGDKYLAMSGSDQKDIGHEASIASTPPSLQCDFCGLEDGILNGHLHNCKRSPLTYETSLLDHFELPVLLTEEEERPVFRVRRLSDWNQVDIVLTDVPGGVRLSEQRTVNQDFGSNEMVPFPHNPVVNQGDVQDFIYAINDRVVCGMNRNEIMDVLRMSELPILIYSSPLPVEALKSSVSIVKCHSLPLEVNLARFGSYCAVQSFNSSLGFGEISRQIFPGDIVVMVNDVWTHGKDVNEVFNLVYPENQFQSVYIVVMRGPNIKMKELMDQWRQYIDGNMTQQSARSAFQMKLLAKQNKERGAMTTYAFDVTFQDGPLGLALALEDRGVVVKSLNDHSNGALGQASLSRQICRGDLVERVNGERYGSLRDLSQFTSWLLSLPRPLVISFSRIVQQQPSGELEEMSSELIQLLSDSELMSSSLGVEAKKIKSIRVRSMPIPFVINENLGSLTVVATNGPIYCESIGDSKNENADTTTINVGDCLVGINGKSLAGLTWASVQALCAEMISVPLYLNFIPFVRFRSLLSAHESCIQSANLAWSECEHLLPKIDEAQKLEHFLNWTVMPRTLSYGKCRNGYQYYRFSNDRHCLYLQSSEGNWLQCHGGIKLLRLLNFLDQDPKDKKICAYIRASFHYVLHGKKGQRHSSDRLCCEFSELPFLLSGPFAVHKEIASSITENEIEQHEAFISYLGRRCWVGTFLVRHQAESALQQAELAVYTLGVHYSPMSSSHETQFVAAAPPALRAESITKRAFVRKYEYGTMDSYGRPKSFPLSQSICLLLRRGLRAVPVPAIDPSRMTHYDNGIHPSYGDHSSYPHNLKRQNDEAAIRLAAELAKRPRYEQQGHHNASSVGNHQSRYQSAGQDSEMKGALSFKRSLHSLADQGRAMLAAWNNFAVAPSAQASNGLAYACLSSFEGVKKAVTRVLVEPNGPLPDPRTFACLHHGYVVGLVCAMTTQALTNSRKTPGDSAFVKMIADAFATSLLSCMDPSPTLRVRALNSFAVVEKRCEPSARPNGLSDELQHVANFILQFLRYSQYLADGKFEDPVRCRPIFSALSRGMETLPTSFLQQMKLLENARKVYTQRHNAQVSIQAGVPYNAGMPSVPSRQERVSPGLVPVGNSALVESNSSLFHVTFGVGPLGIVINYSSRGTIIVTEFSHDKGMMGQAQLSGKICIGDEVYAVNGSRLDVIGMEGFKSTVANGTRPLQVTFRRYSQSNMTGSRSMNSGVVAAMLDNDVSKRQVLQNAPPAQNFPRVSDMSSQSNRFSVPMNPNGAPQQSSYEPLSAADSYYNESTPNPSIAQPLNDNGYSTQQIAANQYAQNMPSFPFESSASQAQSSTNASSQASYNMPSMPYMGAVPGPFSGEATVSQYESLPSLYDGSATQGQLPSAWEDPNSQRNYSDVSNSMPGFAPNGGGMNSSDGVGMPLPFPSVPMGFQPPALPSRSTGAGFNEPTGYSSFVAPNDPNISQDDVNPSGYYDNNDTTYRSGFGFQLDASNITPIDVPQHPEGAADAETEPESPTGSILTNANSEFGDNEVPTEDDSNLLSGGHQGGVLRSNMDSLGTAIPSSTPSSSEIVTQMNDEPNVPPQNISSSVENTSNAEARSEPTPEDYAEAFSRRSSRVPKKITSNIGDLYNPDLVKAGGRNGGRNANEGDTLEPTSGEVGELATELLEDFHNTIQPLNPKTPYALQLLRAQLLAMEAAIPRDAFRTGRWIRPVRAAWAEMVYSCDTSSTLLEAVLFLESNIESEWLDPVWKASPLQTAKNALSSVTIASAAMRLYALDDAIAYIRVKRAGKRKQQRGMPNATASASSTQNVYKEATPAVTHPSELPFMSSLSSGTIGLANNAINRILAGQRDKSLSSYMLRKVRFPSYSLRAFIVLILKVCL